MKSVQHINHYKHGAVLPDVESVINAINNAQPCVKRCTDLLQVNVVRQLHVLCVNLEDLQPAGGVGDADVHLSVETPWTTRPEGITKKRPACIHLHFTTLIDLKQTGTIG